MAPACHWLGDIETIEYKAAAADGPCALPDLGPGQLRLVHLAGSPDAVDWCLSADPGVRHAPASPFWAELGVDCPDSQQYLDATNLIGLEEGDYEISVVPAGHACDDGEIAASTSLSLSAESGPQTVVLYGTGLQDASLATFGERSVSGAVAVRAVNVVAGAGAISMGLTTSSRLPAELADVQNRYFERVPSGGVADASDASENSIDERGYIEFGPVPFNWGFAAEGEDEALATIRAPFIRDTAYTAYAAGALGSSEYPPRIWLCDDHPIDSLWATCGVPREVSVETYAPQLTDDFTAAVPERRDALADALGAVDSDLLCITEVQDPTVASVIADAAKAAGFVVLSSDDSGVPIDREHLDTRSGQLPTAEPSVPCSGENAARISDLMSCLAGEGDQGGCAESTADGTRLNVSGFPAYNCISANCAEESSALLQAPAGVESADDPLVDRQRCWMCGIVHLSGRETLEAVESRCTTEPAQHFAFDGRTGLMVLARRASASEQPLDLDLDRAVVELLPSSDWQRAVLTVPVQLDYNGAEFDFHCAHLSTVNTTQLLPYTGPYGGGAYGRDGAVAEQQLQARRLVEHVARMSRGRGARSIVGGIFYSGPAFVTADGREVGAVRPETYETLLGAWEPLLAPSYTPACTVCGTDSGGPGGDYNEIFNVPAIASTTHATEWTTHLFGDGFPASRLLSTERTFTEDVVHLERETTPISTDYGLRTLVQVVTQ